MSARVEYAEFEAEVEDEVFDEEIEFEPTFKMPPTGPLGGEVDIEALFARAAKFSNVFPDVGALIAPTMPMDYKWELWMKRRNLPAWQ